MKVTLLRAKYPPTDGAFFMAEKVELEVVPRIGEEVRWGTGWVRRWTVHNVIHDADTKEIMVSVA